MSDLTLLLLGLLAACLLQLGLWVQQQRSHNAGIVDVGWAASLGAIAAIYAFAGSGDPGRRLLIGLMVAIWSTRLTAHLWARVVGKPEEGRYLALRKAWSPKPGRRFFLFFQAQAVLAALLSLPFLLAAGATRPLGLWDAVAAVLFVAALAGETIADRQLARFVADARNRGKTCRDGLWRYSRHPNYFFEWLVWISFAAVGTPAAWGAFAWLSPLLILIFVLKITGIPPTEAQALRSRGDDYRQYQRETSAFFPWFPRRVHKVETEHVV